MSSQRPQKPPLSWWRRPQQLLRQVTRLNDTPHRIALGASIGMFIGWTPTVGIQMLLVVLVAFLCRPFFRFNQFAGLVAVYVSNPITTVPMYWIMYQVGTWFVPGRATYARFVEVLHYESFAGWWNTVWTLFVDIGQPLLLGSLLLGTIFGVLTYPAMRWLLKSTHRPSPLAPGKDSADEDDGEALEDETATINNVVDETAANVALPVVESPRSAANADTRTQGSSTPPTARSPIPEESAI